jgi:hypothetical protein
MIGPCGVALKEWAAVVSALLSGRQTVLLRKGGIEEGPGGFRPEHEVFWLYPTAFHQGSQGLREGEEPGSLPPPAAGEVILPGLAVVEGWWWLDREKDLKALEDEHIWSDETISKRFHYKRPGLWVMAVTAYRVAAPVRIEEREDYAGCKSWVPLGLEVEANDLAAALPPEEAAARREKVERAVVRPGGEG